MREYSLSHLSDAVLLRDLAEVVRRDRVTTSVLLRTSRRSTPASSTSRWISVRARLLRRALGMSEESALRRIQAARAARRFPVLFVAVAEGRLHLTAVGLLAPHLTPENVDEFVAAATKRSKVEIEDLPARRGAPKPETHGTVSVAPPECVTQHSLANVESVNSAQVRMEETSVGSSPESQTTRGRRALCRQDHGRSWTHERLRYAQALLSHAVPTGDLAKYSTERSSP
jgi:hypothetical protein